MTVFTCEDNFISMMTCVYTAWASRLGHSNVKLQIEPVFQQELFNEYIHVDADEEKAESVVSSLRNKVSTSCYVWIYYVSCSNAPDKLDLIYRFVVKAFHFGPGIVEMLQDPTVMRMMEIRRRVGNEGHLFREFLRFSSIDNKIYVAHFEPENDVLMMVAEHFADRMPSEYWVIVDDTRKISAVHPMNSAFYLRELSDKEFMDLKRADALHDDFVELWKGYFDSIAIKERENYRCQRGHFPIWMRKHATEFLFKDV